MGTEIITISATSETPHPLTITDNEGNHGNSNAKDFTTKVHHGDKVKWKIKQNSAVQSIEGIDCTNGNNLFSTGPCPKNNGIWEGTISNAATGEEEYSIVYKVGGVTYTQDPKLRIPSS